MNKVIVDFLNSGLTESEYFNLSSEDLITLKEYLIEMRDKDKEFMELIKEPLDSMKDKCGWINTIGYDVLHQSSTGEYIMSSIKLIPVEGRNLTVHKKIDSDKYTNLAEGFPKFYLLNRGIRIENERSKELPYIQDELSEIDQIGISFYKGLLGSKLSVSGNFGISCHPNVTMDVYAMDGVHYDELLSRYPVRKMKEYEKPYLGEEEKSKVLTKIQIKKSK